MSMSQKYLDHKQLDTFLFPYCMSYRNNERNNKIAIKSNRKLLDAIIANIIDFLIEPIQVKNTM